MAGKHTAVGSPSGFGSPSNVTNLPPVYPGSRTDRAYAEGRAAGFGGLGNGPHATGTPEYYAWENGCFYFNQAAEKVQTAVD